MEAVLTIDTDGRGRKLYRHGSRRVSRKRWHELAPKTDIHIDGEHAEVSHRYTYRGSIWIGKSCPKEGLRELHV